MKIFVWKLLFSFIRLHLREYSSAVKFIMIHSRKFKSFQWKFVDLGFGRHANFRVGELGVFGTLAGGILCDEVPGKWESLAPPPLPPTRLLPTTYESFTLYKSSAHKPLYTNMKNTVYLTDSIFLISRKKYCILRFYEVLWDQIINLFCKFIFVKSEKLYLNLS